MQIYEDSQIVRCPSCSSKTSCQPVTTIREGTNELNDLFVGALNKVKCTACSVEFLVDIPLIYRHDKRPFLAYYAPLTPEEQMQEAISQVEKLYQKNFEGLPNGDMPKCRITFSRKDFIEKIAIHQWEYDDRLIEYIKYQLFQHSTKGLDPHRMDLLFDFSTSNNDHLSFLAFDRQTGQAVYSLKFLNSDYIHLVEHFLQNSEMEIRLNQLYRNYYVHVSSIL